MFKIIQSNFNFFFDTIEVYKYLLEYAPCEQILVSLENDKD